MVEKHTEKLARSGKAREWQKKMDTKLVHRDRSEPQQEQEQEGFPSGEKSHKIEVIKCQHRPRLSRKMSH